MSRSVTLKELRPGHVVNLAWDPEERTLNLARPGGILLPPQLVHVGATISVLERDPQPDDGPYSCTWKLAVLYEGNEFRTTTKDYSWWTLVDPHHEVCGECGEMWPCRDSRIDSAARQLTSRLDSACAHCGRHIGGAWYETFNDGVTRRHYHTAKKYRGPDGRPCHVALAEARATLPGIGEVAS